MEDHVLWWVQIYPIPAWWAHQGRKRGAWTDSSIIPSANCTSLWGHYVSKVWGQLITWIYWITRLFYQRIFFFPDLPYPVISWWWRWQCQDLWTVKKQFREHENIAKFVKESDFFFFLFLYRKIYRNKFCTTEETYRNISCTLFFRRHFPDVLLFKMLSNTHG